nr:putative beta-glucosidase 41 isoform X1 [Ipomoea batatas]
MATILGLFCLASLFLKSESISRADFPHGFIFGTSSSAFQFEGAVDEGNKGPSIWDTFSKKPGRILDFSNANTTVDQYHRFRGDIDLMKDMGMDAYRFSISWTRIFPNGTGEPNPKGIEYYNSLIDALLEKGIQPFATLYHWDLPQSLEDEYGGFLSNQIVYVSRILNIMHLPASNFSGIESRTGSRLTSRTVIQSKAMTWGFKLLGGAQFLDICSARKGNHPLSHIL